MNARLQGDFFDGEVCELWVGESCLDVFWRTRRGASRRALQRRVRYGGRKGRSAARRLWIGDRQRRAIVAWANNRYGLAL